MTPAMRYFYQLVKQSADKFIPGQEARRELNNADVTKKSLECESFIRARMPAASSIPGKGRHHGM
jgi:hypothetical protein